MSWKLAILFMFFTIFLNAQEKYSNEFLSIGVGARQMGMGNVATASSNDVYSTYWNPAGLTKIEDNMQLGGMHSEYFAGISNFEYLGLGINANEKSALGISLIRFGIDNIPNTTALIDENGALQYDRITSFSAVDYAFYVSYAQKLKYFTLGLNAKIIYRKAGDFAKAWGFGVDAGLLYEKNNWLIGLMLQDITTTVNNWSYNMDELEETFILTGNEIPEGSTEITLPKANFGFAYDYKITGKIGLLTETDLNFTFDGERNTLIHTSAFNIDPKLGFEFNYNTIVFLRTGLHKMQRVTNVDDEEKFIMALNMGVGVNIKIINLSIDYAYTDIGSKTIGLNSHVISLRYDVAQKNKRRK